MPDEIIDISFDNEDKKPQQDKDRLVIDFDDDAQNESVEEKIEEKTQERAEEKAEDPIKPVVSLEEQVKELKVDSFYRASPTLSNYYSSEIKFPEGIEISYHENSMTDLKDTFLNSILESNKYLIVSSSGGSVYAVDRFTKKIKRRLSFNNEAFEKTGLVYENKMIINSIRSIYGISENDIETGNTPSASYTSNAGYYIWSSLNREKNVVVFLEYSPESKSGNIVLINGVNVSVLFMQNFEVRNYLNHLVCLLNGKAFFIADNILYIMDLSLNNLQEIKLNAEFNENSEIFADGNKLYLTSDDGKIYFLENGTGELKYTGICETYINSCAAFEGNIFIGTESGWKYYNAGGALVYSHDDIEENKIEAVSKNMLIVSRKNKVIFHNLVRFQEAEGFVIKNEDDTRGQEIFSAVISYNEIYVLTKDGILSSFVNDMLNIHI
ncbi:MAG TPA: hypothetical protein VK004_02345 [Ignavibacteria bacterium]|nr:hypothetical protein [Ignavibacteria bacterium]